MTGKVAAYQRSARNIKIKEEANKIIGLAVASKHHQSVAAVYKGA